MAKKFYVTVTTTLKNGDTVQERRELTGKMFLEMILIVLWFTPWALLGYLIGWTKFLFNITIYFSWTWGCERSHKWAQKFKKRFNELGTITDEA